MISPHEHIQLTLEVGGGPPALSSFRIAGALDTLHAQLPGHAARQQPLVDISVSLR